MITPNIIDMKLSFYRKISTIFIIIKTSSHNLIIYCFVKYSNTRCIVKMCKISYYKVFVYLYTY